MTGPSSSANYLAGTNNVNYGAPANGNSNTAPAFTTAYINVDRRSAYQVGESACVPTPTHACPTTGSGEATLISTPAALDEGGNFIRPQFGPLSLETAASAGFWGNYHLTAGVNGRNLCGGASNLFGACGTGVPGAVLFDFDNQGRPTGTPAINGAPHRGADQSVLPVPTTPVPQR